MSVNISRFNIVLVLFNLLIVSNVKAQSSSKDHFESAVSATIDRNTTEDDFEGITEILSEYNIQVKFSNITRNNTKEINSIGIKLISGNDRISSNISSNRPIQPITFGSKNGKLFIGENMSNPHTTALFNGTNNLNLDSIITNRFKSFNFDHFFSDKSSLFILNGDTLDIKSLKESFFNNFNLENGNYFSHKTEENATEFNFIDNPYKDTLIVINGEISNFEALDKLAKSKQIKSVDILKPETAMSIYGDKAKDGAIIAITKQ